MSNHFTPQIERLRDEVRDWGKLGPTSTIRLLNLVEQMSQEIANLRRRLPDAGRAALAVSEREA